MKTPGGRIALTEFVVLSKPQLLPVSFPERCRSVHGICGSLSLPAENGGGPVDYCYAHTLFYRLRSVFDMCDYRAPGTCGASSVNSRSLKMLTANRHFRSIRFAASDVKASKRTVMWPVLPFFFFF